jgi:predicted CXXCH cytochrome family protein
MRPFGLRADALAAYRSSHHGQAVLEKGSVDAPTCTECHGVHDVRRKSDPLSPAHPANVPETCGGCHADTERMERSGLTANAPAEFARSVHGRELAEGTEGVPSCADCHDAHAAAPPGAAEVADVCGTCHETIRLRFREGPHLAAFEKQGLSQCVTCHGNHGVDRPRYDLFDATNGDEAAGGQGARCLSCHDGPDDAGGDVARAFGSGFRGADERLVVAWEQITALAAAGFYADEERETLDRARVALERAVPLSHAVDLPRIDASLRRVESLIDEALLGREKKLRWARDRRIYGTLAGIILLGMSWFLALRRRRVRRR